MKVLFLLCLPFLYHLGWDGEAPLYNVYRMDAGGAFLVGPAVAMPVWLEESVAENSLYTYWVKGVYDGVESDPSNSLGVWTGLRGDVSRDGSVDRADLVQLAGYLAGNPGEVNRQADVDDNFQFNAVDLVIMMEVVDGSN